MEKNKKFPPETAGEEVPDSKYGSKKSGSRTAHSRGNSRKFNSKKDASGLPTRSGFVCSTGRPTNDPSWYLNYPAISRDVGSIWFSRPGGDYIPKLFSSPEVTYTESDYKLNPGVCVNLTRTTWGGGEYTNTATWEASTPINSVAAKLYQFVVHANSRNISYDAKDLMLSIMAIDAIHQMITEAIRVYRFIASYSPLNKFVKGMVRYLGWDIAPSEVAQFRAFINIAIAKVNKFFMPALFDIHKSHLAAYQNVYLDRPDPKGQIIVNVPRGFWVYSDLHGVLAYSDALEVNNILYDYAYGQRTPATWFAICDAMISNIENAQYMGVMQGDILKAFGSEKLFQMPFIDLDMPIAPIYDEEFLFKWHNSEVHDDVNYGRKDNYYTWLDFAPDTRYARVTHIYRDDDAVSGKIIGIGIVPNLSNAYLKDPMADELNRSYLFDLPPLMPADPSTISLMTLYKAYPRWDRPNTILCPTLPNEKIYAYGSRWNPEEIENVLIFGDFNDQLVPSVEGVTYVSANDISAMLKAVRTISLKHRFNKAPLTFTRTTQSVESGDTANVRSIDWEINNMVDIPTTSMYKINTSIWWSLWSSSEIHAN